MNDLKLFATDSSRRRLVFLNSDCLYSPRNNYSQALLLRISNSLAGGFFLVRGWTLLAIGGKGLALRS